MEDFRFPPFEYHPGDDRLYSSVADQPRFEPHVGQIRISFSYCQCGPTSIIAQQISDPEGGYTFRKWNPLLEKVSFGEKTDAEGDHARLPLIFCYICECVNLCFNKMFEEVVDMFVDGSKTPEKYFEE